MPRRAFFRTLSGTFSSKQQQQDSNNDAQALQRRPPTIEEGGRGGAGEAGRAAPESVAYRRRTSHTLRPKERKQTGLTAAALEVRNCFRLESKTTGTCSVSCFPKPADILAYMGGRDERKASVSQASQTRFDESCRGEDDGRTLSSSLRLTISSATSTQRRKADVENNPLSA